MTAINALLMPGEVHLFADGGHYSGKTLRRVGPKVYPLPKLNAALAWSGPSDDIRHVLRCVEFSEAVDLPDLIEKLPHMIEGLRWKHMFTVVLVGCHRGEAIGVTIEEGGKLHELDTGSVVAALKSKVKFNPVDIVNSGISMMEDQRKTHQIVGGFIQYVRIGWDGIRSDILREWKDIVIVGSSLTQAAKISELEVDKITIDKFGDNATIGCMIASIANGGSVVVPNEENLPVIFSIYFQLSYVGGASGSAWARCNWGLARTRGSIQAASGGMVKQGAGNYTHYMNGSGIDSTSQNNDTYTMTVTTSTLNGASMTASNGKIKATYIRR